MICHQPLGIRFRAVTWLVGAILIGCLALSLRFGAAVSYEGKSVAFWVGELCASDPASRRQASQVAAEFGAEAVPPLAHLLRAAEGGVGPRLRALLARCWPAFASPAIPPARLREQAARCLGQLGPVAAPAAADLVQGLGDPDPDVAVAAGSALKRIGPAGLGAIGTGLSDASPTIRGAAASLLAATDAFGSDVRHWREALLALAADPDAWVRSRVARTLGELPEAGPDTVRALSLLAEDRDAGVSEEALEALARVGGAAQAALPVVLRRLEAPDPGLRLKAARASWQIAGEASSVLPTLVAALEDQPTRWQAALILGEMGQAAEPAIPALLDAMTHEIVHRPARTPASCARALARVGPAAVPGLVELLAHEAVSVRASAAYALWAQGAHAAPAVAGLVRLLDEGDAEVGVLACQALGAIGAEARVAVPRLRELSETTTGYLRAAALDALARITGSPAWAQSGSATNAEGG